MINNNTLEQGFSADLFNVSQEFEDIQIVIDELNGDAMMEAVSRRC